MICFITFDNYLINDGNEGLFRSIKKRVGLRDKRGKHQKNAYRPRAM